MKIRLAGLALALAAPMLLAQTDAKTWTPPSPQEMAQHHVQHLTEALSLTPDQQQKATAILTESATKTTALHENEKAAHQALAAAVKANNAGIIQQQAAVLGQLETQRIIAESMAHAALYQILTPEQQAKADQLHKDHMGMGMHHGPHGVPPAPQQ
ncbi:MAG: Spy/CpxP family protein refolding chaperone [Acidobacteriales bacterium]|nr:Spy/CpxP family protein refolding chaperone [Terriglobales bacterium]